MRVLVLGGTTEASALATLLSAHDEIDAMLSLAGRTRAPARPPVPYRIGGFGGVAGLVDYLGAQAIDAVVDATHPFAEQISANALAACTQTGTPMLVLTRPAWEPQPGEVWQHADGADAAARLIGQAPRRVFLTVGRLSVPAFAAAPQHHYLVRSIDPPGGLDALPSHTLVLARGPFAIEDERALIRDHGIEVLVTKNSGGGATAAKLAAAREAGLGVIMIRRPPGSVAAEVHAPEDALAWILAQHGRRKALHAPPP